MALTAYSNPRTQRNGARIKHISQNQPTNIFPFSHSLTLTHTSQQRQTKGAQNPHAKETHAALKNMDTHHTEKSEHTRKKRTYICIQHAGEIKWGMHVGWNNTNETNHTRPDETKKAPLLSVPSTQYHRSRPTIQIDVCMCGRQHVTCQERPNQVHTLL